MKIHIPEPCHVPISDMSPSKMGYYCDLCAKEVIDFRSWSEADIQQYFKEKAGEKSCGIFVKKQLTQLKTVVILPSVDISFLSFKQQFLYALLICFGSLFMSCGQNQTTGTLVVDHPYADSINTNIDSITSTDSSSNVIPSRNATETIYSDEITAGAPEIEDLMVDGLELRPLDEPSVNDTIIKCEEKVASSDGTLLGDVAVTGNFEIMPEFPGGEKVLLQFLQENIRYPNYEKEHGIYGKVYVKFLVEKDGTISKVEIMRGVENAPNFNTEVLRVIKLMPKWEPGKRNGKPHKIWFNLPIEFKLE